MPPTQTQKKPGTGFTLDDIRAAAERKYGAVDFQLPDGRVCKLVNVLRLPKDARDEMLAVQDRLKDESVDQETTLVSALKIVAEDESLAEELVASLNGDLGMLAAVFDLYTKGTEAGEA